MQRCGLLNNIIIIITIIITTLLEVMTRFPWNKNVVFSLVYFLLFPYENFNLFRNILPLKDGFIR